MNLVSKSSFLYHSKNVMRLGVMLVITSMIVSWVAVPKAKAVAVVDDVALGAAATAAYLTSTGIPLTVTAGGASAASAGIVSVAGEYAVATGVAASGAAFLGSLATGIAVVGGCIIVGAAAAAALSAFADWLHTTYFSDSDAPVLYSDSYIVASDGTRISLFDFGVKSGYCLTPLSYGSKLVGDFSYSFDTGTVLRVYSILSDSALSGYGISVVNKKLRINISTDLSYKDGMYFGLANYNGFLQIYRYQDKKLNWLYNYDYNFSDVFCSPSDESLSANEINYAPIPEIAPTKNLVFDIGAPPEITLDAVPEFAFEKVSQGEWGEPANVPYTVQDADPVVDPTPDPNPDPDPDPDPADPGSGDPTVPPDTPDIDDLGLPDLGAALTTRFPFSIPWDIYRGLKLLSAPAVVPKFEVDFFAPLNNRVGGWKGDTKIVIDFGYYPEFSFIGELCRWTSTIGYCLFLASATKRFIWTA